MLQEASVSQLVTIYVKYESNSMIMDGAMRVDVAVRGRVRSIGANVKTPQSLREEALNHLRHKDLIARTWVVPPQM